MSGTSSDTPPPSFVQSLEELEALYSPGPNRASTIKVADQLTAEYQAWIEASPFVVLATVGPGGLDCSPRGDAAAVVRVADSKTLLLPDRRGNNRIDSLRNIVSDGRLALLFLVPRSGTTLRVNGRARVSVERSLLDSFAVKDKAPRSVIVVAIESAFFQCARAIVRSRLWDAESRDVAALPTPGQMLSAISGGEVGGPEYDAQWPGRAARTLW